MSDKTADGEKEVLKAIDAMPEVDRAIGARLHEIIKESAPELTPRTWYGMPAYTNGNKIVCFFRSRQKFGERYMTFGFNDVASLDEGYLWPVQYALTKLSPDTEPAIATLVKRAVS